jgi:hypothetical protein
MLFCTIISSNVWIMASLIAASVMNVESFCSPMIKEKKWNWESIQIIITNCHGLCANKWEIIYVYLCFTYTVRYFCLYLYFSSTAPWFFVLFVYLTNFLLQVVMICIVFQEICVRICIIKLMFLGILNRSISFMLVMIVVKSKVVVVMIL